MNPKILMTLLMLYLNRSIGACLDGIDEEFVSDVCARPPIAGLTRVKLINYDEIDRTLTQFDADNLCITDLVMNVGYFSTEIPGFKQSNNVGFTIVEEENLPNGFSHNYSGVVFEMTKEARQNIRKLNADNRVVIVVENKFKGINNTLAYEIFGYNVGLTLSADTTRSSNENKGTLQLSLITPDGEPEPHEPYLFLVNDSYTDTTTAFDAL